MAPATTTTAVWGMETKTGSRSQLTEGKLDMAPGTTSRRAFWRGSRQNDADLPELLARDATPALVGPRACRARMQDSSSADPGLGERLLGTPGRERADADDDLGLELGDDPLER